eukprot:gene2439-5379_t
MASSSSSSFVLLTVPAGRHTIQELQSRIPRNCRAGQLDIPLNRAGTLDELVSLSDELQKHDTFIENVTTKIAHNFAELLQDRSKLRDKLLVDSKPIQVYVSQFEWDSRRYNAKQPVRDLMQTVTQQASGIEIDLKKYMQSYSKVKSSLQAVEKKNIGSLLTRSLSDIVKRQHVVQDSEFLTTLMVVVPKYAYKDWLSSYVSLTEYVCPESSELISEDSEYGLFSVTLFRRIVDDFKAAARENKFTVREFEFDESSIQEEERMSTALSTEFREKHARLMEWLSVSFDQAFTAWMHLKALRLFVESVLRYGLPPNFLYFAISHGEDSKKLRNELQRLYGYLDKAGGVNEEVIDMTGLFNGEYYPYVSFTVKLESILGKK